MSAALAKERREIRLYLSYENAIHKLNLLLTREDPFTKFSYKLKSISSIGIA